MDDVRRRARRARREASRLVGAIGWVAAHPSRRRDAAGRLLKKVRLGGVLPPVDPDGSRLDYVGLRFLGRHAQPLDDPPVVPAVGATHMREDDVVVGIELGGSARAYPWWVVDNHHVVNDVVGGEPLVLMFCELCSTAVVFSARRGTERVWFDHGPHYRGTNTFRDRRTGSVWAPYLLRAITGPSKGERLELLPSFHMTWGVWRRRAPGTDVLLGAECERRGHGSKQTIGSPGVPPSFRKTVVHWDTRLEHNALVLGAVLEDSAVAFVLDELREALVVNWELAGQPVVAIGDAEPGSYAAGAYHRELDGSVLTFRAAGGRVIDVESGSSWDVTGTATDGPLRGRRLAPVDSHVAEWYVWAANYPQIELQRPSETQRATDDVAEDL